MTALLRPARARARAPRRRHVVATSVRRHAPAHRAAVRRAEPAWELRSFGAASATIVVGFVLALAYLASSTGVATVGYEAQRLEAARDELRRQNALLDVRLATLASPARIEAEATRLGLVRVSFVPVVQADPLSSRGDPLAARR